MPRYSRDSKYGCKKNEKEIQKYKKKKKKKKIQKIQEIHPIPPTSPPRLKVACLPSRLTFYLAFPLLIQEISR